MGGDHHVGRRGAALIAPGQLVRFKHGRGRAGAIYVVLAVEGPDAFERMALILHPGGDTSWQYPHNLAPIL